MDTIKVQKRNSKKTAKQLRRDGIIPGNIHGGSLEHSIAIQMSEKQAEALYAGKRVGSTLRLDLEGEKIPVLIKEKKRIGTKIEHFVFEALKADTVVHSVAHIFLHNTELVPGQLERNLFEVPFASLPKDMIDTVTLDLEGKPVGTLVTVGDLPEFQNPDIQVKLPMDTMIYRIREKVSAAEEA